MPPPPLPTPACIHHILQLLRHTCTFFEIYEIYEIYSKSIYILQLMRKRYFEINEIYEICKTSKYIYWVHCTKKQAIKSVVFIINI